MSTSVMPGIIPAPARVSPVAACNAKSSNIVMSDQTAMPDHHKTDLPIPAAALRVKDPVCGMVVDPQKSANKVIHDGGPYYFCSADFCGSTTIPQTGSFTRSAA